MPILLNPRHEKFAQLLAQGMNQSAAYKECGFKAQGEQRRKSASSLATKLDLKKRVEELQQENARRHEITLDDLTKMAQMAYGHAMKLGQTQAAVQAVKALGVLTGHWIEKKDADTRSTVSVISEQPMSESEWISSHGEKQ